MNLHITNMLCVFYYLVYFTFVIRMFLVDMRQENMVEWIETLEKNIKDLENRIKESNQVFEDKISDVDSCVNIVKSKVYNDNTKNEEIDYRLSIIENRLGIH